MKAKGQYSYDERKCLMYYKVGYVCAKLRKREGVWELSNK